MRKILSLTLPLILAASMGCARSNRDCRDFQDYEFQGNIDGQDINFRYQPINDFDELYMPGLCDNMSSYTSLDIIGDENNLSFIDCDNTDNLMNGDCNGKIDVLLITDNITGELVESYTRKGTVNKRIMKEAQITYEEYLQKISDEKFKKTFEIIDKGVKNE